MTTRGKPAILFFAPASTATAIVQGLLSADGACWRLLGSCGTWNPLSCRLSVHPMWQSYVSKCAYMPVRTSNFCSFETLPGQETSLSTPAPREACDVLCAARTAPRRAAGSAHPRCETSSTTLARVGCSFAGRTLMAAGRMPMAAG